MLNADKKKRDHISSGFGSRVMIALRLLLSLVSSSSLASWRKEAWKERRIHEK
jgi:hypothetical protein